MRKTGSWAIAAGVLAVSIYLADLLLNRETLTAHHRSPGNGVITGLLIIAVLLLLRFFLKSKHPDKK
ncbi:hypothetical protein [Niabella sp.]|uniref:hypothetical protein n=1 Tax=Niabella sp. TaxID=1962976 RepID=UPI002620FF2E|nr:hypothetical protein [Niabella sp.]